MVVTSYGKVTRRYKASRHFVIQSREAPLPIIVRNGTLFRLYSATGLMMTRDPGARGQGIPAHLPCTHSPCTILRKLTVPMSINLISALTTALFLVCVMLVDYLYPVRNPSNGVEVDRGR